MNPANVSASSSGEMLRGLATAQHDSSRGIFVIVTLSEAKRLTGEATYQRTFGTTAV